MNKTRKLELKDIIGFFPFKLNVLYNKEIREVDGFSNRQDVLGINLKSKNGSKYNGTEVYIQNIKPILRPMSDLTKPMTHPDINNGEEFVPLLKLAEIIEYNSDQYLGHYSTLTYNNGTVFINRHGETQEEFRHKNGLCFELSSIIEERYILYPILSTMPFILEFLNQFHFDYKDLICQRLAVDINTIKTDMK